jgi:N,N'-diacetyllegionaminate synthase
LVAAAHHAGADAVKFQIFSGQPLFAPHVGDDARQARWNDTLLSLTSWATVRVMCEDLGIDFIGSVFDERALDMLLQLEPRYVKVASRCVETFPYAKVKKQPLLISNGFGKMLPPLGGQEAWFLQCSSQYPTPLAAARWKGETDGLSDHSGTPWPGIDAALRGAKFVEVHFETHENNSGPDKAVALTVEELLLICEASHAAAAMREN